MEQRRKFVEILRIELEDLAEDVKAMEDNTRGRAARGEITEYVLKENLAVLERERRGIAAARDCLAAVRPGDYGSLEEMIADMRSQLDDCIRCGHFEPVVRTLVERRLAKVARYVGQDVAGPRA